MNTVKKRKIPLLHSGGTPLLLVQLSNGECGDDPHVVPHTRLNACVVNEGRMLNRAHTALGSQPDALRCERDKRREHEKESQERK